VEGVAAVAAGHSGYRHNRCKVWPHRPHQSLAPNQLNRHYYFRSQCLLVLEGEEVWALQCNSNNHFTNNFTFCAIHLIKDLPYNTVIKGDSKL